MVVVVVIVGDGVVVVRLFALEISFSGFAEAKCQRFYKINQILQPYPLWQQHQTKRYRDIKVDAFSQFFSANSGFLLESWEMVVCLLS